MIHFFASIELLCSRAAAAHFLAVKEQRNRGPEFDIYSRRQFDNEFSVKMDILCDKLLVSLLILRPIAIFKATVDSLLTMDSAST